MKANPQKGDFQIRSISDSQVLCPKYTVSSEIGIYLQHLGGNQRQHLIAYVVLEVSWTLLTRVLNILKEDRLNIL